MESISEEARDWNFILETRLLPLVLLFSPAAFDALMACPLLTRCDIRQKA
jgi:hypothetical protein